MFTTMTGLASSVCTDLATEGAVLARLELGCWRPLLHVCCTTRGPSQMTIQTQSRLARGQRTTSSTTPAPHHWHFMETSEGISSSRHLAQLTTPPVFPSAHNHTAPSGDPLRTQPSLLT